MIIKNKEKTMKIGIDEIKRRIIPVLRRYGVKRAGLFGSCACNEMDENSDIDILVEISEDISLLDFAGIKVELEEILNREVDLIEYDAIKPILKKKILDQQVVIL